VSAYGDALANGFESLRRTLHPTLSFALERYDLATGYEEIVIPQTHFVVSNPKSLEAFADDSKFTVELIEGFAASAAEIEAATHVAMSGWRYQIKESILSFDDGKVWRLTLHPVEAMI
jgi:hypothetical protein